MTVKYCDSIKLAKGELCGTEKPIENWDVDLDNIVISNWIKTMITPKYLIGCCFYIELMLKKVITVKNAQSATIDILSIGLNFENYFVLVVIIF